MWITSKKQSVQSVHEENSMKTNKIEEYGILTIGMCLVSVAFYFFMMPNKLLTGSMMGLAVVLGEVIALPVSVISMSLNIVCLLIGFLTVGREFGVKTIYASFITPAFLGLWEILFPNISSLTGELVIDIVFYILLGSIGQAMAFHVHASSGGTDIIAKVLNQYLHMDLGKAGAFTGIVIVASSLFIYDLRSMLIGILAAYINGLAVDEFIGGFTRKRSCVFCPINMRKLKIILFMIFIAALRCILR